ncbi:hypothetical protein LXA43DRAFT_1066522 [Ganoderma leucocontextum]|nr:hypothetical protein LXA43DRAFT_1066522 [Ganoderma leucocontextum]
MQKIRRNVSQLEWAYEERPDANSPDRAQWERAMAGKVNALAHHLNSSAEMPPALPPLTLCGLYLHNIRSSAEGGVFNMSQLRPVHRQHPVFTDPHHAIGIAVDFEGDKFPLFPRDKSMVDWWKTWGTASRVSETPGLGRTPESMLTARLAAQIPCIKPEVRLAKSSSPQTHRSLSVPDQSLATVAVSCVTPSLIAAAAPTTPPILTVPRVHLTPTSPRRPLSSAAFGVVPQTPIETDKKRKTSSSPSSSPGGEKTRATFNTGLAHGTRNEDRQASSGRTTRVTTEVVHGTDDGSLPSAADDQRLLSHTNPPSARRIQPAVYMSTNHYGPTSRGRPKLLAPDSRNKKIKLDTDKPHSSSGRSKTKKGKGKARAIPRDEDAESDEQCEVGHENRDETDIESHDEDEKKDEHGGIAKTHPAVEEGDEEAEGEIEFDDEHEHEEADENALGDYQTTEEVEDRNEEDEAEDDDADGEEDVAGEGDHTDDGSDSDAEADEDDQAVGAEEEVCAVVKKNNRSRKQNKNIIPPEPLFDPEELEWGWYEHGQKVRACYQAYRWWKQQCRPNIHPGNHPHPGDRLHDRAVPDWFRNLYYKLHVSDPPPPPKVTNLPCGKPTVATVNDARFAHLGVPVGAKSDPETVRLNQVDKVTDVPVGSEADDTNGVGDVSDLGDGNQAGEAEVTLSDSPLVNDKVEDQSTESEGVVQDSDDEFFSVSGPSTRNKATSKTQSKPQTRKKKAVQGSEIGTASNRTTVHKLARTQNNERNTVRDESDVEMVGDLSTAANVRASSKAWNALEQSDIEVVEDEETTVASLRKRKKKQDIAGEEAPVEMLSDASTTTNVPRKSKKRKTVDHSEVDTVENVQPVVKGKSKPNKKSTAPKDSRSSVASSSRGSEQVSTLRDVKHRRASGQPTSQGMADVQPVHGGDVDGNEDADTPSQKRHETMDVEDDVLHDCGSDAPDTGGNGNHDEIFKTEIDVVIDENSSVGQWEMDTFEFLDFDDLLQERQFGIGNLEVGTSQFPLPPFQSPLPPTRIGLELVQRRQSSLNIGGWSTTPISGIEHTNIKRCKCHAPTMSEVDEQNISQAGEAAISIVEKQTALILQAQPVPSGQTMTTSLPFLAPVPVVSSPVGISGEHATADTLLTTVLKVTDTLRDTLCTTYNILLSRHETGGNTLPGDTDGTPTLDRLSHGLQNLTVNLLLFGSMFDGISTCFEMLAGVLKLDDSPTLSLDKMADSTRMLLDLYNATGQEWGRLRNMLTGPLSANSGEVTLHSRFVAVAKEMEREMHVMAPELGRLPGKLVDVANRKGDVAQVLMTAARVLSAGGEVVERERQAIGNVVRSLQPPFATAPSSLPLADLDVHVFEPAFPTTLQLMDTLSGVSKKLLELEQDVASLKQGKFIEDYLTTLGISPGSLQAVAQFTNSLVGMEFGMGAD